VKRSAALLALLALAGCGGTGSPSDPPVSAQRDVAQRFARAILSGRAHAAVTLLVHPGDDGLSRQAASAAAPWKAGPATIRFPGTHRGNHWTFRYAGTHNHRDGRFEQVRGDLVVVVAGSRKGAAAVEFFALIHETKRFSTHHDSVLLPSNR
jgi:hypothetical protein